MRYASTMILSSALPFPNSWCPRSESLTPTQKHRKTYPCEGTPVLFEESGLSAQLLDTSRPQAPRVP